ncbi:peptidase M14 (plasmid) [Natrinema zhouii]|uniref:M14 family zinc carboxypeptidase n=1 Tax=Natrinema zhouii TaxID=1710539 RepID=UPI001D000B6D|nr:M14 family zinc carboxypeptidase [Natrinema zhouii]UHQ98658.1 peptidase M14 [Natrinema zhouii]
MDQLDNIQQRARANVTLEEIGESIEGRELVVTTVGSGDTDIFIVTEQHGGEPHGTNAMVEELQHLATSGKEYAEKVRNELTVHILPQANPDGAMRNQRGNAEGIDMNRQHHYPVGATNNPSPEAQAMIDYVTDLNPLWVTDIHCQGGAFSGEKDNPGHYYTSSIYWPTNPEADPEAVELSRQLNVAMWDQVDGYANAQLSRYPGGTGAEIARNAYGIRGYGSVLMEMTATHEHPALSGQMINQCRKQIEVMLEDTVDDVLFDRDPDRADNIPDRPARTAWKFAWDQPPHE